MAPTSPNIELLMLAVLRQRPMHGYAAISALRESSNGSFDLSEGSVYPVLHRLEAEGLLASSMDRSNGRARRTDRITAVGTEALARQTHQWNEYASAMDAVIGSLRGVKGAHA